VTSGFCHGVDEIWDFTHVKSQKDMKEIKARKKKIIFLIISNGSYSGYNFIL
jgi:hypothetical protein